MTSSHRRSAVKDAIDDIMRRLDALPPSSDSNSLRGQIDECQRERETWSATAPPSKEKEALMKRVLRLHLDVAELERKAKSS